MSNGNGSLPMNLFLYLSVHCFKSSRVDEFTTEMIHPQFCRDAISRSPSTMTHERPFDSDHRVEQAALSRVRFSEKNNDRQSLFDPREASFLLTEFKFS